MKMTVSLLKAFQFYCECPGSWKDRAMDSIKNTLTAKFTGSPETARGERYEARVNRLLYEQHSFTKAERPLNGLKGMTQQQWLKPLTVTVCHDGVDLPFTFKGRMDYIGIPNDQYIKHYGVKKGTTIIADLKTTGGEIKPERYTSTPQHLVYCTAMQVPYFSYVVARLDQTETAVELVVMSLDLSDIKPTAVQRLKKLIEQFVEFLHTHNLWQDYYTVFNGANA